MFCSAVMHLACIVISKASSHVQALKPYFNKWRACLQQSSNWALHYWLTAVKLRSHVSRANGDLPPHLHCVTKPVCCTNWSIHIQMGFNKARDMQAVLCRFPHYFPTVLMPLLNRDMALQECGSADRAIKFCLLSLQVLGHPYKLN